MTKLDRRRLLATSAGAVAGSMLAGGAMLGGSRSAAAQAKPRVTFISQWAAGSDGAAITGFGKMLEEKGVTWEHSPVPGFTTDMMNKVRALILAGDPPAASQLKGPEIAAWSKIAKNVDITAQVEAQNYASLMPPSLVGIHKPNGPWIALPIQIHRINGMFIPKKNMEKVGAKDVPTTWAEFNELAERFKKAGLVPLANGGIRWDDLMKLEIALAGINPTSYRKALMELDDDALQGPDMIAAFKQLRLLASWLDPNVAAQSSAAFIPRMMQGEIGMLLMGTWAQGNIRNLGFDPKDVLIVPAPQDDKKPCFIVNADSAIFWERPEADLKAGQKAMVDMLMTKEAQTRYSQTTGSIPVRIDVDLSGEGWTEGQRIAAKQMKDAVALDRAVLSLAHNMAQPNGITAAMNDVATEFVHDPNYDPEKAVAMLFDAVDGAR